MSAVQRGPTLRVLIVDDEPGIQDVVETYLRDEGFAVEQSDRNGTTFRVALPGTPAVQAQSVSPP